MQARITTAVERGEVVLTPIRPVMIGSTPAITWLEIDLTTGEVSGVLPDGTRSDIAEEGDVDGEETLEITEALETEEGTAAPQKPMLSWRPWPSKRAVQFECVQGRHSRGLRSTRRRR